MYHPFSIAETLATAWGILKKNFITIIVYSVVTTFISLIFGVVLAIFITTNNWYVIMFVSLLTAAFESYTTLGLYKLIFTLIDSDIYEFEIKQILPRFTMLMSFLVIDFLFAAIVFNYNLLVKRAQSFELLQSVLMYAGLFGLLYFISRGVYFLCFILDDDSGPFESIKQSFQLTKGYFLKSLSILCILLLLIAVPALLSKYVIWAPFLLIFSFPYCNILVMVAYRKLVYSQKDVDDLETETV